ncbi:MAG TPA: nucleotidyltransferase domain-containing protein, partial [Chitinophagaceae bacterium]|nr:nucleotidyltransferase domain-containing protein [Chitinophagaceae bacterium]
LLQVKNNRHARGLRKVETELSASDLENLKITIAQYNRESILKALDNTISIYKNLRRKLYDGNVQLQTRAENLSMEYLKEVARK